MTEDLEKAKKLFFDYSCNKFFMARDGADSEYKTYGATKEHEDEWRKEYIAYWKVRLSIDDLEAVNQLNYAWAVEAMPELIKMCNQAEGYAKLWYSNAIWELSKSKQLPENVRRQAIETSIKGWESLVMGNFSIPEHFQKKIIPNLRPLGATTPEEYVINYATRQLEEAKKRSNF